ncbi:hypothetical protein DES53_103376 [Roseimicrobium gellanilyticum]|uniref:Fibronectin type-III domain-containing protein n=1 Tax=Roseimicrobium gellanilyticum TaxID=748857 RepID=A0A366HRK4_9BACT|nr:hypothetical protein [Roseimicrobium gellanilyticum]RBP45378.1 hypothetical protein DES53_103376 [Roseimicrobium gellanilyticum]
MEWLLLALLAPLVLVPVVLMCGFAGCGSFGAGEAPTTPPPTSLIAERTGDRKITLRWTHPEATAKFRISRGESSGSVAPVPALQDIAGTQADDIDLPEGTTFFYQLIATDVTGTVLSAAFTSAEASATTRPAAPSDLVATPGLNSSNLTWKNNSNKATRFTLERAGANFEITQSGGAPPAHQDTTTTPGTTYEYRLRAFVDGVNKGVPERVVSVPDVKVTVTTLSFKPVFPPPTGMPVPLTTDQAAPGFCFVQRIGTDRLANSGTQVRVTIRGAVTGPLILSAITISHAVPSGEAWDSAAPLVLLGTNVTVPAGVSVTLPPAAFALDKTKPLLIAFDVSSTMGQGNVRYGPLVDAQTKMYVKAATQQAQTANRASDFQPSNNFYLIEKIEAA